MPRLPLPPAEPMRLVALAEIAKGGMGSVELARVEGGRFAGRFFAIKRLHPQIAQDPQFVGMFLDEAWMTAALRSPNVVQVAAWGNDESGMFLAVELVQGVSLARLIKESKENQEPFAERTVAFFASQILNGMAAAHGLRGPDGALLGLVHRDLTPGNLLVGFDGVVKIADFGIAKAEERITHTRTGTLKGKPAYMAPEQARGGKVDARSDLFSFGVVLYELLAGRRPWTATGAFDLMMEAATEPAPDLGSLRKGVSPVFIEVVHACLAKKPEERPNSAAEVQAKLDAWRHQRGFVSDDQASMSQFVRRNSQKQIAWFEQALRGDFAAHEAPSFKELEEKIDESRTKATPSGRGPRPAAGRDAPEQTRPTAQQVVKPVGIAYTQPMPTHVLKKAFAMGADRQAANAAPDPGLGGTQLMAESPFGVPDALPGPASPRPAPRGLALPPSRRDAPPAYGGYPAPPPAQLAPAPPQQAPPPARPRPRVPLAALETNVANPRVQAAGRSRTAIVLLAVVVVLLAGLAVGGWLMRDRLGFGTNTSGR